MIVICLCRRGFEKEVAAEISDKAASMGIVGFVKAQPDLAYVEYVCPNGNDALTLIEKTPFEECIFIRHWFVAKRIVTHLPKDDRVTPLYECAVELPFLKSLEPIGFDTNEGKSLKALAKGVANHVRSLLKKANKMRGSSQWMGQLVFFDGETACIGMYPKNNGSQWDEGIPRLRLPKDAPSRATLKLEEAWHQFIPAALWDKRIAPSMRAVDLGAAPGGWTWQLVNKSMFVDAVDHGPMDAAIMDSGQVKHCVEDAYKYAPARRVDWLVSDIADKPARVASLIANWGANGWCKEAIFNLKLPMKKRYQELLFCDALIRDSLEAQGVQFTLQFKQLYHDREEVTGHLFLQQ